jgi:hypothetical protein
MLASSSPRSTLSIITTVPPSGNWASAIMPAAWVMGATARLTGGVSKFHAAIQPSVLTVRKSQGERVILGRPVVPPVEPWKPVARGS